MPFPAGPSRGRQTSPIWDLTTVYSAGCGPHSSLLGPHTPPHPADAWRRAAQRQQDAVFAATYPELRAFTPDATLYEIKSRFGLNSREDVRELTKRRLAA